MQFFVLHFAAPKLLTAEGHDELTDGCVNRTILCSAVQHKQSQATQ